jgi:hypothetical protein
VNVRCISTALVGLVLLVATAPAIATSPSNTLRWKVEGERGNFGFLVYRATDPAGPFRRVTAEILQSTGSLRYVAVDRNVRSGKTYYYVIYSVGTNGVKQQLSPVVAKLTQ